MGEGRRRHQWHQQYHKAHCHSVGKENSDDDDRLSGNKGKWRKADCGQTKSNCYHDCSREEDFDP